MAGLCAQVAGIPGTDLGRLIAALAPAPGTAQQVLEELLALGAEPGRRRPPPIPHAGRLGPGHRRAVRRQMATPRPRRHSDAELDRYQDSPDWGALVAVLRRVRAGDTGDDVLTGLDETDAAIVTRALDARDGKVSIPAALWPAIGLRWWLADVVAGARGDEAAAARARQVIEEVAKDPGLSALADVFRRILDGDRDVGLADGLDDPVARAVVATVVQHVGTR